MGRSLIFKYWLISYKTKIQIAVQNYPTIFGPVSGKVYEITLNKKKVVSDAKWFMQKLNFSITLNFVAVQNCPILRWCHADQLYLVQAVLDSGIPYMKGGANMDTASLDLLQSPCGPSSSSVMKC